MRVRGTTPLGVSVAGWLGLVLGVSLAGGCVGDDLAGPGRVPASLTKVMGDSQQVTVGATAALPLVVEVTDAQGSPVSGVLINFTGDSGGGSVSPNAVTTGPDGRAASGWHAPTLVGRYIVRASAAGVDSVLFSSASIPAAAAALALVSGDSQAAPVGSPLPQPVTVRVNDRFGNPVAGAVVQFTALGNQGQLLQTDSASDSVGIIHATWTVGMSGGVDTLRVLLDTLDTLSVIGFAAESVLALPITAGDLSHSCRLTITGAAECWGDNVGGELGDGTNTMRYTPVAVQGSQHFHHVVAGMLHSCGLTSGGQAWCWGLDWVGLSSFVPVSVAPGLVLRTIDAGENFTCGVDSAGGGYCWGRGVEGQLGNGFQNSRQTPAGVYGIHHFRQIATGSFHACGVTIEGETWCWGDNQFGQLGDSTLTASASPRRVRTAQRFFAISAGVNHSCALTADGHAFCWGSNGAGQLGNFSTATALTPDSVWTDVQFRQISVGFGFTCGRALDGRGYCWGANHVEQLGKGLGNGGATSWPQEIAGGHRFLAIVAGGLHACGWTDLGETLCWGDNRQGQVGVGGPTATASAPVAVAGGTEFSQLASAGDNTCGLTAAGQAWCWGRYWPNQPAPLAGGLTFTRLSAGWSETCGITVSGAAYCWSTGSGQPFQLPGTITWASLAPGADHLCGISTTGTGYCWGSNDRGQLGDSTTIGRAVPVPVAGGHQFLEMSVGRQMSCGLVLDGSAWCWGRDSMLGDGSTVDRPYPGPVSGGQAFTRLVSTSNGVTCAATAAGEGWCWGRNDYGQLGNGQSGAGLIGLVPGLITGGHSFASLGLLETSSCGVTTTGGGFCWGWNGTGQLGTGDLLSSPNPVGVVGPTDFQQVAGGVFHACALDTAGAAWCWGDNLRGQLGNGVSGTIVSPALIP